MRKGVKILLIVSACVVVVGIIIFVVVMSMFNWNFSIFNKGSFENNTYDISDEFTKINLNTETADINFEVSADNTCKVICYEEKNMKHSVDVTDGTLNISFNDDRNWFEKIGFYVETPKITVYLPQKEYLSLVVDGSTGDIYIPKDFIFGSLDINISTGHVECLASTSGHMNITTSTGDIRLRDLTSKELNLSVTTGHVEAKSVTCEGNVIVNVSTGDASLSDVYCYGFNSSGSTGDINLENVVIKGMLSINRSTGDVEFEVCDADMLDINTSTGEVKGSLLSPKVFITNTDTGEVDVPKTTSGGKCEITTGTGDITIKVVSIQ